MNCNGTQARIFMVFFLIIALLRATSCQQKSKLKAKDVDEPDNSLVGTKGDLYEVFKKRLEKFNSEMSLNTDGLFDEKPSKTHIADEKRSTVRECLYEEYKKRLDKINNELSLDGEKVFDRSGRNTNKENAVNSEKTAVKDTIGDVPHVPVKDNLPPAAAENIVKKKNVEIEIPEIVVNQGDVEKPQHKVNEEDNLKNKDLIKLQANGQAVEEPAPDKLAKNKNENDGSENNVKPLSLAKLIIPTEQSNTAKLITPAKNEPDLKDKASNIFRRQTEESTLDNSENDPKIAAMSAELIPSDLSPSYPSVLTKGLNPNMTPGTHIASSTLLNSVASKLKTSPLDLAKKLATASDGSANIKNDPKLTKLLQKYIESSVNVNSNGRTAKDTIADAALTESLCMPQDLPHYQITAQPQNSPQPQLQAQCPITAPIQTLEYNSVSNILEKVLSKLEQIQDSKPDNMSDKFCEVEGAPCEVLGIWNSYVMGLRFGIKSANGSKRRFDAKCAEPENLVLSIDVQETNPPKLHQIMDTGWKFTGSSMKQLGGPFFIISETRAQNVLATFAGYCRTCGSIDTIFGSWTFVFPSKDCQDITVSIENKRDIFRRDLLDAKIGERYSSATCDKGKKGKCMPKHK